MAGQNSTVWLKASSVFLALSLPLLVMGPAEIAIALALALIAGVIGLGRTGLRAIFLAWAAAPTVRVVALVLLTWLLGVVFSGDPLHSAGFWARTAGFLTVVGLCAEVPRLQPGLAGLALKAFVAASAVALGITLAALYVHPDFLAWARLQPGRDFLPAATLKSYANAVLLMIPILALGAMRLTGTWRAVSMAAIAAALAVILATQSKSPMAGGLAMLMVFLLGAVFGGWSKTRRAVTLAAVLVAAAATLANVSGLGLGRSVAGFEPYLPTSLVDIHRQAIWAFVFDTAMTRPWTGFGLNLSNFVPGAHAEAYGLGQEMVPGHPHNWFLEIMIEAGVAAALATLGGVIWFLLRLLRDFARRPDAAVLVAMAVAGGYWTAGLFNFSFWSAWWQVAHLVALGLALALAREPRPPGDMAA